MTIQRKTGLLFTGITATILLLTSYVAYVFMNAFAFQDFYKRLEIRAVITAKARLATHQISIGELYDIREQHLEPLPGEREYFFPDDSLSVFRKTAAGMELPSDFYTQLATGAPTNFRKGNYFYTGLIYDDDGGSGGYVAIVGAENEDSLRYSHKLKLILVMCSLVGIIIAYTSGIFFSRHAYKAVRDVIDKARTIKAENLHQRLPEPTAEDELAELTATINDMLSRLETAFETQNNFVSNASHEFRTPLTAIYGEAEITLSRPRSAEEYRGALNSILLQAQKLRNLTDSLLGLAQTGFDGRKPATDEILLPDLLLEVKETINNIIPGNNVQITVADSYVNAGSPAIIGDRQLLKLGLSNVTENGCKYSGNDLVTVLLEVKEGWVCVTVQDRGIGIPVAELSRIYDPFFRASNTGKFEGYGIGLPLTRNIMRLHKGAILVSSDAGKGTRVELRFPQAPVV